MSYFLDAILPSQGYYFVVAIRNGKVKQVHASSIEEIEAFADKAMAVGADAYFAIASFKDSSARTAVNASHKKAFYLDIDCGPSKDYPDLLSARAALENFIESSGLPDPLIVSSGFGLHVYWPLIAEVQTGAWAPVAKALKQLCVDHGLKADPVVTADAARILRVPGTKNFKNGHPRDVQIVQQGNPISFADFAKLMPQAPDTSFLEAAKNLAGQNGDVGATITGPMPTWNFKRIAEASLAGHGCQQIKFAIENASQVSEPMWRAALSVAWCCEDKAEAIHDVSRAHPEYTAEATTAKAKQTNGAWHCSTYKDHFPEHCQGCTHKVTSPLAFGKIVHATKAVDGVYKVESNYIVNQSEAPTVVKLVEDIPEYPFPYFRGVTGGVYRHVRDEDGNTTEVMLFEHDMYIKSRAYDSEAHGEGSGEVYTIRIILPHDGVRELTMAAADIMSKEKLVQGLAREGAFLYGTKQVDAIMGYLIASMRTLRDKDIADFTRSQMGWTPGNKSFVIGNLEYDAKGFRMAPPCAGLRQLAEHFRKKGTLEEWREAANFYARPGQEAKAFALLSGFASPLIAMFDSATIRGALINLISTESGTGKTTCLLMINSLWGNPDQLLLKQEDTYNAKFHRLGMHNSIACTVDELTTLQDKDMSSFIFAASSGRGKHRMEAQSNKMRVNNSSWCNLTVSSSNRSISDILDAQSTAAEGEKRRLIELYVTPTEEDKAQVDWVFSKIVHNYGHAGPAYMEYILKHYDEVKELLLATQRALDAELRMTSAERYYSALYAAIFVACRIVNHLGLVNLPLAPIKAYAVGVLTGIKQSQSETVVADTSTATSALGSYLADNLVGALVLSTTPVAGMQTAPHTVPRGPLRYRYEIDTKAIWIPVREFNQYLTDHRLNTAQITKTLADAGVLKAWATKDGQTTSRPKRVASGMVANMAVPSVRCYCFDGSKIESLPEAVNAAVYP